MEHSIEDLLQDYSYIQGHNDENMYHYHAYLKSLVRSTIANMSVLDRVNYIGKGYGSECLAHIENTIIKKTCGKDRADLLNYIYTELCNTIEETNLDTSCKPS
jgi:hypothetical protein